MKSRRLFKPSQARTRRLHRGDENANELDVAKYVDRMSEDTSAARPWDADIFYDCHPEKFARCISSWMKHEEEKSGEYILAAHQNDTLESQISSLPTHMQRLARWAIRVRYQLPRVLRTAQQFVGTLHIPGRTVSLERLILPANHASTCVVAVRDTYISFRAYRSAMTDDGDIVLGTENGVFWNKNASSVPKALLHRRSDNKAVNRLPRSWKSTNGQSLDLLADGQVEAFADCFDGLIAAAEMTMFLDFLRDSSVSADEAKQMQSAIDVLEEETNIVRQLMLPGYYVTYPKHSTVGAPTQPFGRNSKAISAADWKELPDWPKGPTPHLRADYSKFVDEPARARFWVGMDSYYSASRDGDMILLKSDNDNEELFPDTAGDSIELQFMPQVLRLADSCQERDVLVYSEGGVDVDLFSEKQWKRRDYKDQTETTTPSVATNQT